MSADALINGLAGAGGGIIAQLLTYPLQTVNTRQQTRRHPSNSNSNSRQQQKKRDHGTIQQMCLIVKHEGWGKLYGGLSPSLVGTAASQGVYYYFYQIFRNRTEAFALDRWKKGLGDGSVGMFQSLLVAALSGCLNVLLTNPIWIVVTRMQTHKNTEKIPPTHALSDVRDEPLQIAAAADPLPYGTLDVVQELFDEAGIWGLWKGVIPTLIMVSNPSIQFMLYETFLKKLKRKRASNMKGADALTAYEIFLLGAVAKLGATVVTYPLNVVKSRLQAKQGADDDKRHHYKGTIDAVTKIVRYEGLAGFYRGMGTKILQSVLAAAVLFMVKEELVKGARLLVMGEIKLVNKAKLQPR